MSNVVSLGLPRRLSLAERHMLLMKNFACNRRKSDDVFWLKENAELLNVLASSGAMLSEEAFEPYRQVYHGLRERLQFFPQYYRFLLSICLDLEDLGIGAGEGTALCDWVQRMGLVDAELSDLQRAEAQRLLSRRGVGTEDAALTRRLKHFIARSDTFALPNKKAAYELTHIVFYLSDYGVKHPMLDENAIVSLEFAGLLAYLDQDVDLLAEVCVAMRFAGRRPSVIWEDWIARQMRGFALRASGPSANDAYHEYLVTSWWAQFADQPSFPGVPDAAGLFVTRDVAGKSPLRAMSEYMFHLGPARSGDWSLMRDALSDAVGADGEVILAGAEQSSDRFGAFFEGFSRADFL
ncbi:hypothetical protein So717_34610 [Roseobacter cerasinus]|uniref:Uncharacterized protein n=1 Tax=Roseobacter cerasinus TaxID=2602289 RepID=A0A640VTJ5_9RHOB|nr:hypothetical protein [Roseobacter cerasinus]GFE51708.1 hypothetical protein So717_34610 [Roseobacter cerasinus]